MMRIKIQMLAMMFIAALALGACSDDVTTRMMSKCPKQCHKH